MLFDRTETADAQAAAVSDSAVGVNFMFDYDKMAYAMEAGSPVQVTGRQAVQAWLEYVVRTARGRYAIHPTDFGARIQDMVGLKAPKGYDLSEFNRQLQETIRYLPAIQGISRPSFDGKSIQCTVTLASSTGETTEVMRIEP